MPPSTLSPSTPARGALPAPAAAACLAAGWKSLRANSPLVAMLWLQNLLVAGLTVAGLALPLAAADLPPIRVLTSLDRFQLQEGWLWLVEDATWQDFVPRSPEMIAALVGLGVLWTAALFVYCGFQAGLYGVLTAAQRRSQAEGTFAAFDLRSFLRCGNRYFWRYFGLLHAFVLYSLVLLAVWTVVMALAVRGWVVWGDLALVGIGCGGSLPVLALLVLLGLWFLLARADVARPDSGIRPAQRRGWRVLRRRPGAVVAFALLFLALGVVVLGLFAPVVLVARGLLSDSPTLWISVRAGIEVVSWVLYAALAVYVGATLVALVQGAAAEGTAA